MHSHFFDRELEAPGIDQEFGVDQSAFGVEGDSIQKAAVDKFKTTVDVLEMNAEKTKNHEMKRLAGKHAREAFGSFQAITDDHLVGFDVFRQKRQFLWVVLKVAVGIKNPVFPGLCEAVDHGLADAQIHRVVDYTDFLEFPGHSIGDLASRIGTVVVNNQNFKIIGQFAGFFHAGAGQRLDGVLIPIGGEENTKTGK